MCERDHAVSRRALVRGAAGIGLVTTVGATTTFPASAAGSTSTQTITGTFDPVTAPDWHYVPVEVPDGVCAIEVSYAYDRTSYGLPNNTEGNILDIGIFDPSGHELGDADGFRGWSGGARSSFRITSSDATPGYLAGPIDAGTWNVALGPYSVSPQGMTWTVSVTLTFGRPGPAYRPQPAPLRVKGVGAGWFRGDMHIHSVHSDGRRTLAEVAADAQAAGLDFIASTDHNTTSAGLDWGRWVPDGFLVINGEEVTTRGGHWLAVGIPAGTWIDWRYRVQDAEFARFSALVRSLGGAVVAAHPYSPFSGTTWTFGYDQVDAIEVWNGPWTLDDQTAVETWHSLLVAGRRIAAVGDSDAHTVANTIGLPQTIVHADALSAGAIVAAVKAGRSWLAESSAVQLELVALRGGASATIGETLGGSGPATVRLTATGVPGCVGVLHGPAGPVAVGQADASGRLELAAAALTGFVRAEVRRPDPSIDTDVTSSAPGGPMVALTNPIWLG